MFTSRDESIFGYGLACVTKNRTPASDALFIKIAKQPVNIFFAADIEFNLLFSL